MEWVLKLNLFLNKDLLGILSTEIILLKTFTLWYSIPLVLILLILIIIIILLLFLFYYCNNNNIYNR